ncbi:MAG: transcriptional regulator [Alphaproteobacteria bacterium]|nr:MAG: transcriptional regulator [Alphaproteobacteria bacterium]
MDIDKKEPVGDNILELATKIVSGYVSKNPVSSAELPEIIQSVHKTLIALSKTERSKLITQKPAVATEDSITEDYIICLEDGKKLKMLKRHLRSKFGLTPDQYRAKWNLPPSYPMVAPGYAIKRSQLAKEIGLGRKPTYLDKK